MGALIENSEYKRWQYKIFGATWLAYVGYYFTRKAFFVVKSDLANSLQLDSIHLAHLGTAYLTFYMIGQYSSAYFGRRLGPKYLLLLGMAISLICNVIFGVSNSYWTVMLFLSLNGMAQGTGWPGCIGSLAYWFKRKQRGTILGIWATCYQVGSLIATSFAAYMLGHYGWKWSFFGASAIMLIIWFFVLLWHPNKPEDVGLAPLVDEDEVSTTSDDGATGKGLGWNREVVFTIVTMGVIYFGIKFLRYALWSWAPFLLKNNFGLQGDDSGYLSTIFDLFGFVGVVFAGYVSDKVFKGRRSFVSFVMLFFMTLSFVLMYTLGSTSLLYFTISMGLAGFMLYGPDALISGAGAIDVGTKKGAMVAAGIINGTGSIGPIFQEELIGWMYERNNHQIEPIFILLVVIAAITASITFLLWIRNRKKIVQL
ncbi:MAG: MFS transporter [Bacteroidales bacterium]|nr:MFS transporter [Bacteroidales bacterium]